MMEIITVEWLEGQLAAFARDFPQLHMDSHTGRTLLAKHLFGNLAKITVLATDPASKALFTALKDLTDK